MPVIAGVLNGNLAMQMTARIHGSSFWPRGASVWSHRAGHYGTQLERSGLAAARGCKGSSQGSSTTRDIQERCEGPPRFSLLIKKEEAHSNKRNSRREHCLVGFRKSSCYSYSSAPGARFPADQVLGNVDHWSPLFPSGQKAPQKTSAASGGDAYPINVLLVLVRKTYQLQFLGTDTTNGQGDVKTLSDRKTCPGVLRWRRMVISKQSTLVRKPRPLRNESQEWEMSQRSEWRTVRRKGALVDRE